MNSLLRTAATLIALSLVAPIAAQDAVPLVRKKSDRVKVTVGKKKKDAEAEKAKANEPDPSTLYVGIVNAHTMTKAQLNHEVEMRFKNLGGKALLADGEGTMYVLGPDMKAESADRNPELREFLKKENETTRRRLESEALQEWVEANLLADEARRQGIVIDSKDFARELANARAEMGVSESEAKRMLKEYGIDESRFEADVYDALLGSRLVDMYIEANWSNEDLRPFYDENPEAFRQPTRVRLAQYVVAATTKENRDDLKKLKDRAERVRRKMEKETKLKELLAEETDLESGFYGTADTGWTTLALEGLPDIVAETAAKMTVGTVSSVLTDIDPYGTGKEVRSYQVIKLLAREEAGAATFENALPELRGMLKAEAREDLIARLMKGKTHRIITNTNSVAPDLLPTQAQLMKLQAAAPFPLVRTDQPRSAGG